MAWRAIGGTIQGMTPLLTDEMRQAMAARPGEPLVVLDAATQQTYVLLPTATFERLEPLLYDDSPADADEFLPLIHDALAADWNAPGMEDYDKYDQHRQSS